jgi:dTDP-4-amino-4,6-dideoxygalactose transaminase
VIEDACEALGAAYNGRSAGTLGDTGVFAFYPNKQATTGEGGVVVTNDASTAALMRSLRNQGRDAMGGWLEHARLGYNYRLDELSAAIGVVQMARLPQLLARRDAVARWYSERLAGASGLASPIVAPTTSRMSWFTYVVRLSPDVDRQAVMTDLARRGIPTRAYFSPIHLQPFYAERFGWQRGDFPVAEALGDACLALPFSGTMSEAHVDRVCVELLHAIERHGDAALQV